MMPYSESVNFWMTGIALGLLGTMTAALALFALAALILACKCVIEVLRPT